MTEPQELHPESVHDMLDEFFDQFSMVYETAIEMEESYTEIWQQIVQHATEYVGAWNDNVRLMRDAE